MRKLITIALLLCSMGVMGQTNQPLPPGSVPLSNILYLAPDSTVWTGDEFNGLFVKVAKWNSVDSLFKLGYTKMQVDSAITAQIGGINFPVTSVNSMTGDVTLDPTDLGLGNVDNTSDANKPISTATQGALDGKENAFSKGSLVAGTGVTLGGTLANRLVGSGNVTLGVAFGTSSGTVAQGNDSRIINGQTAYNRGDFRSYGLGSNSISISNFDNIDETGFYYNPTVSTPGAPTTHSFYAITHIKTSSTSATQTAIRAGSPQFFFRRKNSGLWSDWAEVYHSESSIPIFSSTRDGLVPSSPPSGNLFLRRDGSWVDPQAGGGGGSNTDLSITGRNANTLQINSSTGSNATVPAATTSLSGLMTASDKAKLNSTPDNFSDYMTLTGVQTAVGLTAFSPTTTGSSVPRSIMVRKHAGDNAFPYISGVDDSGESFWLSSTELSGIQLNLSRGGISTANHGTSSEWNAKADIGVSASQVRNNSQLDARYLQASNFTWSNLSGKPSTFTPSAHSHNASDINAGTLASARIPNLAASKITSGTFDIARIPTGTTGSTVALGNDSRINNGQTAFGWGDWRNRTMQSAGWAYQASSWNIQISNDWTGFVKGTGGSPSGNSELGFIVSDLDDAKYLALSTNGSGLSWQNETGTWNNFWHSGNFNPSNYAQLGTGSSQVRNNSQLDGRYVQLTGNQSISGTKTFSSPVVAPQYQGTSTTASSSIPTNAQSLFKATISSNTNYTLTNLSGNPRQIQVMVTNTSGSTVYVNFLGGSVRMADGATDNVPAAATVIFTFLIENGTAWGVKSTFL